MRPSHPPMSILIYSSWRQSKGPIFNLFKEIKRKCLLPIIPMENKFLLRRCQLQIQFCFLLTTLPIPSHFSIFLFLTLIWREMSSFVTHSRHSRHRIFPPWISFQGKRDEKYKKTTKNGSSIQIFYREKWGLEKGGFSWRFVA